MSDNEFAVKLTEDAPAESGRDAELKSKYPEFFEIKQKLEAERDAIRAAAAPLRDERDKLVQKIQPTENKIRELNKAIVAIERPRLAEIENQLGGIAKMMGGKSLQAAEV